MWREPHFICILRTPYNELFFFFVLHACARGEAIGFVHLFVCLSISTKIARSGDLGIIAKYKYHYSVGEMGKLTFFSLLHA